MQGRKLIRSLGLSSVTKRGDEFVELVKIFVFLQVAILTFISYTVSRSNEN